MSGSQGNQPRVESGDAAVSLFARYFESGLLEFGFDLLQGAIARPSAFSQVLRQTTSFVRKCTDSFGAFASRQDTQHGPIRVIPETSDGFDHSPMPPSVLLDAPLVRRAHEGHLACGAVGVNGGTLQVAALPVYKQDDCSLAMTFARVHEFQPVDLEIINFVRNIACRAVPRDFPRLSQATQIMRVSGDYLQRALSTYDDELERHNCIAISAQRVYSLAVFMNLSLAFQEAVTLLHVAVRLAEDGDLSKDQLSLLRSCLIEFAESEVGPDVVDRYWKAFFDAGIDVDMPLRGSADRGEGLNGDTRRIP
jgi:hypothetical protein